MKRLALRIKNSRDDWSYRLESGRKMGASCSLQSFLGAVEVGDEEEERGASVVEATN